ncbi:MAG: hypothetical protein J6K97_03970, partial [Clostridia bacterium]|nr:hypothetical protein [Clostridia bacterium]
EVKMPRIKLERKRLIGNNIYEVKEVIYEVPEHIMFKGEYLSYDSYHQEYQNLRGDLSLSAKEYIKITLNQAAKKQGKYIDEQDKETEI